VKKLNLGCGDKILPGYVNVDVVEARAGMKPDVICDLHDLVPFADASADEILSVHVLEHFWRWECSTSCTVEARSETGREHHSRVSNLLTASLPSRTRVACRCGAGRPAHDVGLWPGRIPMIHRWGYTPASLRPHEGSRFHERPAEPAQFKLREPRDSA
jgi:hypothetical protein